MDAVGEAWSQGVIAVYQEHLCTDVVIRHLSSALANTRSQKDQPRILLATPTDELHALGMLMARCVLSDQGATCIGVGPQTPMSELAAAATSWKADIVGVSFSFSYPTQRVRPLITHLRTLLPSRVSIWVGGSGAKHLQQEPPEGVQVFRDLQSPLDALKAWPHG